MESNDLPFVSMVLFTVTPHTMGSSSRMTADLPEPGKLVPPRGRLGYQLPPPGQCRLRVAYLFTGPRYLSSQSRLSRMNSLRGTA